MALVTLRPGFCQPFWQTQGSSFGVVSQWLDLYLKDAVHTPDFFWMEENQRSSCIAPGFPHPTAQLEQVKCNHFTQGEYEVVFKFSVRTVLISKFIPICPHQLIRYRLSQEKGQ